MLFYLFILNKYRTHKRSEMPIRHVTEVQTPREYKLISNMLLERETLQNKVMLTTASSYRMQKYHKTPE